MSFHALDRDLFFVKEITRMGEFEMFFFIEEFCPQSFLKHVSLTGPKVMEDVKIGYDYFSHTLVFVT